MKITIRLSIALLILLIQSSHFSAQPISLQRDISIEKILITKPSPVRLLLDDKTSRLYYITTTGNLYALSKKNNVWTDTIVASPAEHGLDGGFMWGAAVHDGVFYLTDNRYINTPLSKREFVKSSVRRGKVGPNGKLVWEPYIDMEPYPSGYDHLATCTLFSPSYDSLYLCVGARTDHGDQRSKDSTFIDVREVPLTTNIYRFPLNKSSIYLPNRQGFLDSSGYIHARGLRMEFDLAFDGQGRLFGVENSDDRDNPEELNWIRRGRHYGFPWIIGGNVNPQQFNDYLPTNDKLANFYLFGFYNDPKFPPPPTGVRFTPSVVNLGPDADKYRDPVTGIIKDASEEGRTLSTFTSHRSPVALVFDTKQQLGGSYTGQGFMLSFRDGTTDDPSPRVKQPTGPFLDVGEDLCQINLIYDRVTDNFMCSTHKIVTGFKGPIAAKLVGNEMYVMEYKGTSIYKLTFPAKSTAIEDNFDQPIITTFPNPANQQIYIRVSNRNETVPIVIEIVNIMGQKVKSIVYSNNSINLLEQINVADLIPGAYFLLVRQGNSIVRTSKIQIVR